MNMRAKQTVFGWFEGMVEKRVVRTLLRWHPGKENVDGTYHESKLAVVAYSSWLAFYTPLSNGGGL